MGDGKTPGLNFSLHLDAPEDLAFDATRADALITVRALPATGAAAEAPVAEVLIMDRSLSMARHGKLDEAKRALCAAVDALDDGSRLAVVAGNHEAEQIYPVGGGLARVDSAARTAAKLQVANQLPEGGTAMGKWLVCAEKILSSVTSTDISRHAVLYTDGKDEHETSEELAAALTACSDRFTCDVRGLGQDWNYEELVRMSAALHGTAEAVIKISDLTEDFVRLIHRVRRVVVPRAYLSLTLADQFRVGFIRQTRPVEADLTDQQRLHGEETHVPLGAWAPQVRQYHLSLRFHADALIIDEKTRAALVGLRTETRAGREACTERHPMLVWRRATPGLKVVRPVDLTRAEHEHELGLAMRACVHAYRDGDRAVADRELRLAFELARHLNDTVRLRWLQRVAVADHADVLRLRPDVGPVDMEKLGIESTKTGPLPEGGIEPPTEHSRVCGQCGETTAASLLKNCENCGSPFDGTVEDAP